MNTVVIAVAVVVLAGSAIPQSAPAHPIVFIEGNGSEPEAAHETQHVRRDDQTMELARHLLKACPEISITRKEDADIDYSLLLNRGDEYGIFKNAVSQVMLLDRDKNVLYSNKEGTVSRAAKDGCRAILEDWKKRRPARTAEPLWNKQNQ